MTATRFITASAAALILTGSATIAHAQIKTRSATPDFTVKSDFTSNPKGVFSPRDSKKTLQWDAKKGKWGLKLGLDQPVGREMELKDVEAGAYFKLTPSIRVGGAVALGDNNPALAARKAEPVEPAPRVRLETAFKF
ncbi:NtrZ family periplasmic regulatory protein [Caulobacter sp. ErkDOM-E]|uniref:NtrZ family periplasmic regulatory protein n=1 Tax=Caulobacter sp. ErkDOM-E TaxID=3402778 RepID=UPI003AF72890